MKWTLSAAILFSLTVTAQTKDTLTNAFAYSSNNISVPVYGLTSNGHPYSVLFRLAYTGETPNAMQVMRIDLTTKDTTVKTLPYTSSSLTFYWRSVMSSNGDIYFGLNSGNRIVTVLNMKDSIWEMNLGNCFLTGTPLAYSMQRGIDGNIYLGASSDENSTQISFVNYLTHEVSKYAKADNQNYVITIQGDNFWMYAQTGQSGNDYWAIRKSDGYKKKLFNNPTLINTATRTTGVFAQYPYPTWSLMTDTTVTASTLSGVSTDYTEVNGSGQIQVSQFYDDIKNKLYSSVDATIDSMNLYNTYQPSAIRRVYPDIYDTNMLSYAGELYGVWYHYNKATSTSTALGHLGINIFDAMQVAPTKRYIVGYPSSALLLLDESLPWTAETFNSPLSASTNPKLIGFGRTTSDVHEPQKIVRLSNGLFCFGGNEIRTGNTVGFNWYDSAANTMSGLNGDNFTPRQYSDVAAWNNKMILSTVSETYHGKLFLFDGTSKALTDSIDWGADNTGYIFIVGDRLYSIAQDTSNSTQTIDTTRFTIVNLSTKQVVYSRKVRGTVFTAQWMPDGFIGINFKQRTGGDQPLINATYPADFFPMRRIDNRTYTYNNKIYYSIDGKYNIEYKGITNSTLPASQSGVVEGILMNMLY